MNHVTIPFTTDVRCAVAAPVRPGNGRPPLLVSLHGQGQSSDRHRRWMGPAVPEHFAAAFPDGFHQHEVRRPDRKVRIGRAWYLYDPDDRPTFFASLQAGSEALWRQIDAAVAALDADPSRIWLAGFSQGAYMSHYTALRHLDRVSGWVGQSGGFREEYGGDPFPDIGGRPVLIQHGRQDEAIGCDVAETTAAMLARHGAKTSLRFYDAGHVIRPEMAEDVREWLELHEPEGGAATRR